MGWDPTKLSKLQSEIIRSKFLKKQVNPLQKTPTKPILNLKGDFEILENLGQLQLNCNLLKISEAWIPSHLKL